MGPKCLTPRFVILLGLLLGTLACSQAPPVPARGSASPTAAQPAPTVSPTSVATVTPPPLGVVPPHCSPGAVPRPVFSQLGPVIGQAPVWATGFDGPHAVVHIPTSYDTYTPYGWTWKLVWEVGPHFSQPVTVQGVNLQTRKPLWFQFNGPETTSPVLDPGQADHPISAAGNGYAEWGSYVFIPAAGCYQLEATWPGGHWLMLFAAGRQAP